MKRLEKGDTIEGLRLEDVKSLFDEINQTRWLKPSFFKNFLCFTSHFCKKDRETKLRRKAVVRFENQLDIRSFINVRTNLALLFEFLLTKKQVLLLKSNRKQVI